MAGTSNTNGIEKPKKRGRPPIKKNKEKIETQEKKKVYCSGCKSTKALSGFYKSANPMHLDGVLPLCKNCVREFANDRDIDSVYELLRTLDKPFLYDVWESAMKSEDNTIGTYIKFLNLRQHEQKTWEDSVFTARQLEESDKYNDDNTPIQTVMQKKKNARKMSDNIKDQNLSTDDIMKLEDKWGFGYDVWELSYFERKYNKLIGNYPSKTSLHEEALKTYCIYKVKAELATAEGDIKDAKVWAEMAQKQGDIAKINLNKLNKSDLSQGLDGFSSLAKMVEKHVDIIPILPKFIGSANDKIDFAIYCFINYERKLHGLPEVEYHEIYDFYQKKLEEHSKKNEFIRDHLKEHEIETKNGKKKILILDISDVIEKKKRENPDDAFIQNLDKWVEFVSWAMWNQDLFYDLITPESGGITLDPDQRILLRAQGRFQNLQGVFSRGYGKCVSGNTMLFTDEGIKEIGEYFNYQADGEETEFSHSINLLNRYGEIENSDKGIYSGLHKTKVLRTEEGYEVEGTEAHPLLVMNKDGENEWKKMEDIKIGDYLPISRNNDAWGDKVDLNIDMSLWMETISGNSNRCRVEKAICNIIDKLDEDFGLILGYLVGDGCIIKDNLILFSNEDEDVVKNFTSFMEGYLGKIVREYFKQSGLEQVDVFNKVVPKSIMEAPKSIVASFMRGLFDTGGGLSDSYIEYCTFSEKMSKQVQTILLNFGIVSTRTKSLNKVGNTYSYRICVYSSNMNKFLKEIGFGCKRKQERLVDICSKKRNSNKGDNQLTYERLDKTLNINKKEVCYEYEDLLELQERNYFYSKVKAIEDSENHVYDIQVPESNSFIANGFVSHNTFLQLMNQFSRSIWRPNSNIAMSAQTRENASSLVREKFHEIFKFYPILNDELEDKPVLAKDTISINWKSGSKNNVLANQQSAKGARRHALTVEESAQMNQTLFEDWVQQSSSVETLLIKLGEPVNVGCVINV